VKCLLETLAAAGIDRDDWETAVCTYARSDMPLMQHPGPKRVMPPSETSMAALQEVAVKIKKRGVETAQRIDFAIMLQLARLASRLPIIRDLRFDDSLSQFGVPLQQQLNFEQEALNLCRFARTFR
jgi:ABC1 atypical kinase-like domain